MENTIISDIVWPCPADAYEACMHYVKELHKLGVIHIHNAVDVFSLDVSLLRLKLDRHRIGLVHWSEVRHCCHDWQHGKMQEFCRALWWSHDDFLETANLKGARHRRGREVFRDRHSVQCCISGKSMLRTSFLLQDVLI